MNIGHKTFSPKKIGIKLGKVISAGHKLPISTNVQSSPVGQLVNGAIKNISNSANIQNLPIKGYITSSNKKQYLVEKPRKTKPDDSSD